MGPRRLQSIVAVLLLVLVAGASAQEPSPTPEPPPSSDLTAPAEPAPSPPPGLTLSAAVARAIEYNDTLLNAGDALLVSRAREGAARASFYPQLTPGLQASQETKALTLSALQRIPYTGGTLEGAAAVRRQDEVDTSFSRSSDYRVTLTQPLLRGAGPNAAFAELRGARRDREGRERSLTLQRHSMAVRVAAAFYQVVQQRQLLVVSGQSLERTRDLLRASEARLEAGLVSKLDVYRAQLQAAEAEDAAVRSEAGLETALENFRTLLGLSSSAPVFPAEVDAAELEPTSEPPATEEDVARLVAVALDRRLEMHEWRDVVEEAGRSTSLARQNLWPQLDLNLRWSRLGYGTSLGTALGAGDGRFDVFLSTSYPLERSSAKVASLSAEMNERSVVRAQEQQGRLIEAEVRAAVRDLERLRRSIALQRRSVEIAEQQHRLANLRYQRGLASNFDVVDAEGSLVLARSALVSLLTSWQVARLELRRATGELDINRDLGE